MFPEEHANHSLQHDKQDDEAPSLRDIVRHETDDGRLIVRFFVSTMQGQLQDAKPSHRIAAARQLVKLGFTEAQDFIDENAPVPKRRRPTEQSSSADRKLASDLAKIVRQETDDGRVAIRFLVDVMQGSLPGFKPHHRLAAARELLRRGFDDTPTDDNAGPGDDDAAAPSDPPDDYDYGKCGIYHYDGRGNMITCESVDCPLWRKRYSVRPAQSEPGHSPHLSRRHLPERTRSLPRPSRRRLPERTRSLPRRSGQHLPGRTRPPTRPGRHAGPPSRQKRPHARLRYPNRVGPQEPSPHLLLAKPRV